jgi:hypothetical protein
MAQKWFRLAVSETDTAQLRVMRARIGQELCAHFDLPLELTARILALLTQLDEQRAGIGDNRLGNAGS